MDTTTYPERIETAALALAALGFEIDDAKHAIGQIEDSILAEILTATNEAGKPLFSNETARAIELRIRLTTDAPWLRLDKLKRELEKTRAYRQVELERLRNEFAVWKLERRAELAAVELLNT